MNYYEEWKEKKISRDEEYELPQFCSHAEARKYFKSIYGHSFEMQDSGMFNGEKIYFYNLILNKDVYRKCVEELKQMGFPKMLKDDGTDECLAFRYMFSHQKIEISEDGRIHIIH